MSNFKNESLTALGQAISLLPLVTDSAGKIISEGSQAVVRLAKAANLGFAYLADEMVMIKLRQDAENAPVEVALKSILKIAKSMDDVDTSKFTQEEHVAHVEKCFALDEITQGLLKKMDDRREAAAA